MRKDVKKILFFGLKEDQSAFFQKAQELGVIQFIDTRAVRSKELPEELQRFTFSLKILRGLPSTEQEELGETTQAPQMVGQILVLNEQVESLQETLRITKLEIARIEIFGDFSTNDIEMIEKEGGRKVQFFCAKEGMAESADLPDPLIYVGTDQGLDYFVSINKERFQDDKMIEMLIPEPLGQLQERLRKTEQQLAEVEEKLKGYAKYNTFLHHALIERLNVYNLNETQKYPEEAMNGALFTVEGWIPIDKIPLLNTLTGQVKVHCEEVGIEKREVAPTYLENYGVHRVGEDLINIYDTPSNTDKDPSLWVLIFFSLFFAIIISDAGYGLVYLAVGMYLFYKAPKVTKGGYRLMTLVTILCGSCLVWGVMTNSFFGINFAPDSPFRKISLLQWFVNKKADYHLSLKDETYNEWLVKFPELGEVNDYTEFLSKGVSVVNGVERYDILNAFSDNILLELALLIGVIHVCLSFLRYLKRNWSGLGWILAIIGAYLYIPSYLHVTSLAQYVFGIDPALAAIEGIYLFTGGFVIALALAFVQRRLAGVTEVTQIIQIFGDILSYLRLYALGLASSIISVTVNEIAGSLGVVFAILLLIVGHSINMVLGIIGGVIHGLRLNFLEWYHYSFEGGGRRFSPLCNIEIE